MGANDGGVKRGDRADTGDLQARPTGGVTREKPGPEELPQVPAPENQPSEETDKTGE